MDEKHMPDTKTRLIVALDYSDAFEALSLAQELVPLRPWVKVGLELLMHAGPRIISDLRDLGLPVFLDGKFHDIPNTVAKAMQASAATGASMINVHASGGVRMMQAAREAADVGAMISGLPRPLVIAVTVLTSLTPQEFRESTGCMCTLEEQAVAQAMLAKDAGLDGVVSSVSEVAKIKDACGNDFLTVTPGIRLAASQDDQRRVATPRAAIRAGADFLVVGRPITQAPDPYAVCAGILSEIEIG